MDLFTYVLVATGIIVLPGPSVLLVISTSINHGLTRGIQTVIGSSIAFIIQLTLVALGTAWLVATLTEGLLWLKWLGVAYLIYLGVKSLIAACKPRQAQTTTSGLGSFKKGFFVALTNPKTMVFFSAFLPQFVNPNQEYLSQIAVLSVIFLVLAFIIDCLYAIASAKAASYISHSARSQNIASGAVFLGASALLANARVSSP